LFQERFGWKNVTYYKYNVTRDYPSREELSQETLEIIRRRNAADTALYQFGQQLFKEQLRDLGEEVEGQVRHLKVFNVIWGPVWRGRSWRRRESLKARAMAKKLLSSRVRVTRRHLAPNLSISPGA
jgi:hypothetical protein